MIRAAWESPTNEGTSYYEIDHPQRVIPNTYKVGKGHEYEWTVGRIILEFSDFYQWRIIVIDKDGKRRVSLPAAVCAWEWLPGEGVDND